MKESSDNTPPKMLEIDASRPRRWIGTTAYVLFFFIVAAVLFVVFLRFTASLALAWGLVVFMVGYMLLMGWLAARNHDRRR
jgi:Flp pilus assembly protein TadB